jgi:three-Cys-motif partner protein
MYVQKSLLYGAEKGQAMNPQFGGSWTEEKLERLRKYLPAYMTLFKSNERARFFKTTYVDAFASTGYRTTTGTSNTLFAEMSEADVEGLRKGSVQIALESEPPFDNYLFIENSQKHTAELTRLVDQFPHKAIRVVQGDANIHLKQWCEETDWKANRAVVFLDPFGMQVEWETLEALAKTQAIDMWLLVPLGMGINRLLTRKKLPPKLWADKLTLTFGTDEWKERFYRTVETLTLFGEEEQTAKDADFAGMKEFIIERLNSIFTKVADNPLVLRNSHNNPLYLLCFAAGNPKGATPAIRIAQDILRE